MFEVTRYRNAYATTCALTTCATTLVGLAVLLGGCGEPFDTDGATRSRSPSRKVTFTTDGYGPGVCPISSPAEPSYQLLSLAPQEGALVALDWGACKLAAKIKSFTVIAQQGLPQHGSSTTVRYRADGRCQADDAACWHMLDSEGNPRTADQTYGPANGAGDYWVVFEADSFDEMMAFVIERQAQSKGSQRELPYYMTVGGVATGP